MNRFLLCLLLFWVCIFTAPAAPPISTHGNNTHESLISALHAVSESDISEWMHTMIHPGMRGRLAGDIGYDLAAEWAAGKLDSWGLKPFFANTGFFQEFAQPYTLVKDKGSLKLHIPFDGGRAITKEYAYADDYWPWGVSGSGEVTGEVVYAGFGITAPELGYDDYAGIDATGKIVICELGIPYTGSSTDTLERWQPYREVQYKIQNAIKHGAAGMLFAYHVAGVRPTVDPDFIFLAVSDSVVSDFLSGTGRQLNEVRAGIRANLAPNSFTTGKMATMALTTEYFPDGRTSNVVAMIEGRHPELKNEFLVIGAHLDHLGMMPVLFPGALDNASGVAIAMGVAKAIAQNDIELDRTLIILLFGAEEVGLVGAKWFVDNFPHPREKIKMMVNLDMVGRGHSFFAFTAEPWEPLLGYLESNNDRWVHRSLMKRASPWAYSFRPRTDGAIFSNQRIPTVHFGTRGATTPTRYHVPEDTMDQIDIEIMRDVVKLLTMSIIEMGNAEGLE